MIGNKLSYITLSGETFPLRCGMEVLEEIQEKYGSIDEFESRIMLFVPQKDEEGKEVVNEEGVAIGQYITPKIKDLGDALYCLLYTSRCV